MLERPRIINVERKPSKCPVCGERVVDIIYGTGEMTELDFMLEYRKEGIMGGDNIPRHPPPFGHVLVDANASVRLILMAQMRQSR